MNKRLFLAVALVAVLLFVGLRTLLKKPEETKVAQPSAVPTPSLTLDQLYQAPRAPVKEMPIAAKETPISEACITLWNEVRGLNMASFSDAKATMVLPASAECTALPSDLAKAQAVYTEQCQAAVQKFKTIKEQEAAKQVCLTSLYRYRGAIAQWLTKDQPLSDIRDMSVLSDRLLSQILDDGATASDPRQTLEQTSLIAERMLQINPDLKPLRKISLGTALVRSMTVGQDGKAKPGEVEEVQRHSQEVVRSALQANPHDIEAQEASVWIESKGLDPALLNKAIESLEPGSPVKQYYSALEAWRSGDKALARELIQQGKEEFRDDARFINAAKETASENGKFPVEVMVRADLKDLQPQK